MITVTYKKEKVDLIECVLKVERLGNTLNLLNLVEDNTNYSTQYNLEKEYKDSDIGRSNIQYMLAYHTEEEPDFYTDEEYNTIHFDNC